jgi:hypothetical protein
MRPISFELADTASPAVFALNGFSIFIKAQPAAIPAQLSLLRHPSLVP